MEKDTLRELKEKIVMFVTQAINERVGEMKIVIDYDGKQYNTEMLMQSEPNKSPRTKREHGTYKEIQT